MSWFFFIDNLELRRYHILQISVIEGENTEIF